MSHQCRCTLLPIARGLSDVSDTGEETTDWEPEGEGEESEPGDVATAVGIVADDLIASVKGAIGQIPTTLTEAVPPRVIVGNVMSDIKPSLKGVTPRGWPEGTTYDEAGGAYDPVTNRIMLTRVDFKVEGGDLSLPFFHEYGHMTDHALNLRQSTVVREAYDADVKAGGEVKPSSLLGYFAANRAGYFAGFSETIAQGVAGIVGKGYFDWRCPGFEAFFPKTIAALRDEIAAATKRGARLAPTPPPRRRAIDDETAEWEWYDAVRDGIHYHAWIRRAREEQAGRSAPSRGQKTKTKKQVGYLLSDSSPLSDEEKKTLVEEIKSGEVVVVDN